MVTFLQTYLKQVKMDRDIRALYAQKTFCASFHAPHKHQFQAFLFACLIQECSTQGTTLGCCLKAGSLINTLM